MSEQYRVTVVFEGRDQLSAVVRQVSGNMADVSKAGSKLGSVLSDIGKTAAGVVGGLVGFSILAEIRQFAVEATRAFVEFERESVKLAALSREAGQSVGLLAQAFRTVASAAAREFAASGQEAMQALEALVKAGLSGRDAVAAVGEVIKLAKIEGVDFASASAAVVQVMAQFGLKGHEAARAVDVLVNASRAGIGTAADFANGLANAGATARAMGLSIEDAATWLVVLERRFGNAQEAGTHLNRFLLELTDIAKKLGVSVTDAAGNMRNMNDVILDVIAAVKNSGLSFAELQERLKGVDMRALKALFTFAQMTENVEELREAIGQAGTATETFGAIMETSAGKFQKMQAQVDLMQRRIGEGFSMIATTLGSVFLPAVDFAVGAWTDIISTATGNIVGQLQGQLQAWLAMGKVTEEVAADIIAANIEMGRITVEEGLKIAESLGVVSDRLVELALLAEAAGVEVPESFRQIAAAASETENQVKALSEAVKGLRSSFDLLGGAISVATNFYDVTLAVSKALYGDVQLTEEASESRERLAATQQVVNYMMQGFNLIQQALQLQMMGATDASNLLLTAFTGLTDALEDGIVTNEEFIAILNTLGVDAMNVSGSLYNVLKTSLEAVKAAVEGDIDTVNSFIATLNNLNGMTVHTYHIHTIIERRVSEGAGQQNEQAILKTLEYAEYQRGTWYVPRTGPAILHEGEMVIPADLAEEIRRGRGRGVVVNITVNGAGMDADQLAEVISRKMVSRLRAL